MRLRGRRAGWRRLRDHRHRRQDARRCFIGAKTKEAKRLRAAVGTPISLDHREDLGDCQERIVRDKAGLIRDGEPFVGMGGVLFRRLARARAKAHNDRSGEVVNLFRIAQRHPEALLTALRWALASREIFARAWTQPPEILTDIERAARFFHILKHNHGGPPEARFFPARSLTPKGIDPGRLRARLDAWHARLTRVSIENLPYEDFIARHDRRETRFHLAPSDWGREDYYGRELFARDDFTRLESLFAELNRCSPG